MTRFIAIASGKGGVGKTTAAINLGMALNNFGKDTIVLDTSLKAPDISLNLGMEYTPNNIHKALEEKTSLLNSVYLHPSGLKVIPGSIRFSDADKNMKGMGKIVRQLSGTSEIILMEIDGFNNSLLELADEVIVIATPDLISVTNALKSIKAAEKKNKVVLGVVLNRVRKDKTELSKDNIETILGYPVLEQIPEHDDVRKAQSARTLVCFAYPNSPVSDSFKRIASMLLQPKQNNI